MAYSLQLMEARLRERGLKARVVGDASMPVEKARLFPGDGRPLRPNALYVCAEPPRALPPGAMSAS